MGFPLVALLLVCAHWFQGDELVRAVQNCIALWAPCNCINRLCVVLNQVGSQTAISRPNLQGSILACSGQSTAIVAPFQINYRFGMSICNSFFGLSCLVINSEAAISESNRKYVTASLGWRNPVVISGERIQLQKFCGLRSGRVPFVHHIVISDATLIKKSTW